MMKNQIIIKDRSALNSHEIDEEIRKFLKNRGGNIEVEVVKIDEMHKLNLRFMHRDCPTDVLSFPLDKIPGETNPDESIIGTIVLCNDIINLNAKKNGKSEREEFIFVLQHGINHLLGIHHN